MLFWRNDMTRDCPVRRAVFRYVGGAAIALLADAGGALAAEWPGLTSGMAIGMLDRYFAANHSAGSRSGLFDDDKPTEEPSKRESREALFGEEAATVKPGSPAWHGFVRGELAYTYANPA